jgi:hypothetical protein
MEDPKDLRDQAQRWRARARFYAAPVAEALIEAAGALERKADRLDDAPASSAAADRRPPTDG